MMSSQSLIRYIRSLALILQESAETGQMDSAVYVDILELLSELVGALEDMMGAR